MMYLLFLFTTVTLLELSPIWQKREYIWVIREQKSRGIRDAVGVCKACANGGSTKLPPRDNVRGFVRLLHYHWSTV